MARADRLHKFNLVGASLIVHILVLSVVWPHQPQLSQRILDMADVAPVIPVIIVRRPQRPPDPPPPVETPTLVPVQTVRPTVVRMTPTTIPQEMLSVTPIIAPVELDPPAPEPPAPTPPPPPTSVVVRPATPAQAGVDGQAAAVGATLRGALGCANADALGLTPAEREKCAEQAAAGAKTLPYAGQGLEADKASALTAAAFRKKQDFEYKRAPVPPGTRSTDGGARDMGRSMGNDRPTAAIRF